MENKEQSKRVPKRRFKDFENDSGWDRCELGEKAEIIAGGDIDKSKIKGYGRYPVIANALNNAGIVGYYEDSYRVEGPAVTVTGRGDVGYAKARNYNFTPVVRLLSLKSEFDTIFLENSINNHNVFVESTGVPQLTIPQLGKYKILFPKLEEQIRIGEFFQSLNQTITLQQQKLEKLKAMKSAYLSEMFPAEGERKPKRRFPGFTDDWEQRYFLNTLKTIVDFRGRTPKKLGMEWSDSGYLALSALNVKKGYIDFAEVAHYGNQELYDKWMSGKELYQGQVLFTTEAPMGNVAQVPDGKGYILSQRTIAFNIDETLLTDDFLYVLLGSPRIFDDLSALSSGGTAKGVSQKSLEQLKVHIPKDLDEQKQIGIFFKNLDQTIILQQEKLEKLQNIKKAYLNEMFI